MHSLTPERLDQLEFSAEELALLKRVGDCCGHHDLFTWHTRESLTAIKQLSLKDSVLSANRMDGLDVPNARALPIIFKREGPASRAEEELAGYRNALTMIQGVTDKGDLHVDHIFLLHSTLFRYVGASPMAGARSHDHHEGAPVTDHVLEVPDAEAPHKREAIDTLIDRYVAALRHDFREPLVVIPLCILDLLRIAPFAEGNEQVARLLMTLLLFDADFQVGRYVSLDRQIEQSREKFDKALEASSEGWEEQRHDVRPWLMYCWELFEGACREFDECIGVLLRGTSYVNRRIRNKVARQTEAFTMNDIHDMLPDITKRTIRKVLNEMSATKYLRAEGTGKDALWFPIREHRLIVNT